MSFEGAAAAAGAKAGAGLFGGLMGGILANMIKPPMKVKTIAGQAIKDEAGAVIMEYDGKSAARIAASAMILGFAGSVVLVDYYDWHWQPLTIIALAALLGGPLVFLTTWLINTLHMRANTDLIATAVDIKNQLK